MAVGVTTTPHRGKTTAPLDVETIRRDFPILQQQTHGKPLIYLDSAATTQKPQAVIDAVSRHYAMDNANVHRGVHLLSTRATDAYEQARGKVQEFIGAARPEEIIFVRGATEAINLVAQTYGHSAIRQGDEIIISTMEHHSNIVPWQILCEQTGAVLRVIPIRDDGGLIFEEYEALLGPRTKLVAVTHASNALGTINPVREIIQLAHHHDIPVLLDGTQAVPHLEVNVQDLDCDFYVFSGHKVFGPTGIGVLYGKYGLLEDLPPYQSGGDMIKTVSFAGTTYGELPYKFEAGTPNIAGAIGLGAALDYLRGVGPERIAAYERGLFEYATKTVSALPRVRLIGTARPKVSVLSFVVESVHPHDAGTILDTEGIAVRAGHHCAQPLMDRLGVPATVRASLALYNTKAEIDALAGGIDKAVRMFS